MSNVERVEQEKTNLTFHVELDRLRLEKTNEEVSEIKKKVNELVSDIAELKELVIEMRDDRNNQLIKWGTAIIVSLVSALGLLFLRIIVPALIGKG
jgi:chromosome segregation ATPase